MTYRDDRDADLARIAALETELGQANRKLATLEHRRPEPESRALLPRHAVERGLGGTVTTFTFPEELPASHCEEAIRTIGDLGGSGRGAVTIAGPRHMTWTGAGVSMEIAIVKGRTLLRCRDTRMRRAWLGPPLAVAAVLTSMAVATEVYAALSAFVVLFVYGVILVRTPPPPDDMFERAAKLLAQAVASAANSR